MEEYPHLNEALGRVLTRRREALGLSKRRLSELAQLERVYIIQLERGDKRPTLNAIFYLCDALDMTRMELMAEIEAEMEQLRQE
jgi:transcriptional regulator with XRE-family HTH domain